MTTTADLRELRLEIRADIAELKADLQKTIITTLTAQTAIFGTIVAIVLGLATYFLSLK